MAQTATDGHLIYVVDDEVNVSRAVAANLASWGYRVTSFDSGTGALASLQEDEPDLVILDVMMPGLNGLDVAWQIRQVSQVPIIMLSVRDDLSTRVLTLGIGADDYVIKPFDPEELVARVQAILRRTAPGRAGPVRKPYRCGGLFIDLAAKRATRCHLGIKLTPHEWALLGVLVEHAGQIMSPRQLLQEAWGPGYGNEGDYVRTYIRRLRLKLEPEPQHPRYILLDRGLGYSMPESD